jgi:hypothetical protein
VLLGGLGIVEPIRVLTAMMMISIRMRMIQMALMTQVNIDTLNRIHWFRQEAIEKGVVQDIEEARERQNERGHEIVERAR